MSRSLGTVTSFGPGRDDAMSTSPTLAPASL
jgi:hypothetical protein